MIIMIIIMIMIMIIIIIIIIIITIIIIIIIMTRISFFKPQNPSTLASLSPSPKNFPPLNQRVAYDFARKASERGEEPVVWEFVFNPILGCKHVNFLERANVEGEEEFLFTAYSVFRVLSQEIKSHPRWTDPHKIVLIIVIFPGLAFVPLVFFCFLFFIFFYFLFFCLFFFFLWTHISCLGLNLRMV